MTIYKDRHEESKFILHYGDMTDSTNLIRLIKKSGQDEIYNLAAMNCIKVSFELPEYVADTDGIGTLRISEAIRLLGFKIKQKYVASTSNYTERFKKFHKTKKLHFVQIALWSCKIICILDNS